jgi:type IV fimbrial biogenesis protein FimT
LSAFPNIRSSGFSLVELMIGVAVMAILVTLAVPNFRTWFQNAQIRNAAESITNGLQRARAEAVARNTSVQFVLGTGSSWTVSVVGDGTQIDHRDSAEGSSNVTVTVVPGGATTVTFNNLGQVTDVAPIAQVDLAAAGGSPLLVTLGVGGNAKMCDPTLPITVPPNPRAC